MLEETNHAITNIFDFQTKTFNVSSMTGQQMGSQTVLLAIVDLAINNPNIIKKANRCLAVRFQNLATLSASSMMT